MSTPADGAGPLADPPHSSVDQQTPSLTHLDAAGQARMVDVGAKPETARTATAIASVTTSPETVRLVQTNSIGKGDVLAIARAAGIMAAKQTDRLIPLCHSLLLTGVDVDVTLDLAGSIEIVATARAEGKTGVEMEALTAVSIAALTIYDMCKAVDRAMAIRDVRLVHKAGGKSGEWRRDQQV